MINLALAFGIRLALVLANAIRDVLLVVVADQRFRHLVGRRRSRSGWLRRSGWLERRMHNGVVKDLRLEKVRQQTATTKGRARNGIRTKAFLTFSILV